ncbi:hypothetical protein [Flavihumibacter profundi]|uniref:hypothetical protein n=1 Tax=Flavihumibacter profundi TaxID=2716883 RepID=UPI001CC43D53|nr:hypothetical protein [Flavihumibacter profundi]MBZ5855686.1 hypothetical protein [Flavihumibacter profundi]
MVKRTFPLTTPAWPLEEPMRLAEGGLQSPFAIDLFCCSAIAACAVFTDGSTDGKQTLNGLFIFTFTN